ncbi:hypothetical protein [Streptomyces caniscabiei]|uniref:hypothetical protein n=1 Tax=Streptomyces caniscabiei TaxID=2746961 RepID=UPI000765D253|nr:hypothetical protein [Streptomyces caniscabiei]
MNSRRAYLIVAFHSFLAGAVTAAIVNAAWYIATDDLPSVLTSIVAADTAVALWSIVHTARLRRKWQTVLDAYERPALGEGIDIPHRPPTDDTNPNDRKDGRP